MCGCFGEDTCYKLISLEQPEATSSDACMHLFSTEGVFLFEQLTHGNEPTDAPLAAGSILKAGKVVWNCFLSFILMQIHL